MAKAKLPEDVLKYFRKQGKRGAKARQAALTAEERSAIASYASTARWAKVKAQKRKPSKRA
jgi:hypothetical protein